MIMLAAIYKGKKNIKVRDIPKPEIDDNEVLLKVKTCSICGTDRKIYEYGHFKIKEKNEQILGHEISGVIEEVGGFVPSKNQIKKITEILGLDEETFNKELSQFYQAKKKELRKQIKER